MRRRSEKTKFKKYVWIGISLGILFLCFYVPTIQTQHAEKTIDIKLKK